MASPAKKARSAPKKPTSPPLPVLELPLARIDPSPLNRDAKRDIAELARSIKEVGQQEPIKVRRRGDRFEIVFGERRFLAIQRLGWPTVHATVEDVDDNTAVALRAVENLQRADPHPLEEAEHYEQLLSLRDSKGKPVHDPESIAELAGRRVAHVYGRLKLTALAPKLRSAVYDGELSIGGAFLIARGVPTALQEAAWLEMRKYAEREACEEDLDEDGHLTRRAIQSIIDRDYSSRLASAPFSRKETKLVPGAGSCEACPKRSGNQRFLFGETDPADTCTDLTCYRAKVAAFVEREKGRVLAAGGTVLTDEDSRRVFQGGSALPFGSKWLDLDAPKPGDEEKRSYRKLLGDLCPPPVLAFTSQGKPVLLAEKEAIAAILEANDLDPSTLTKLTPARKTRGSSPASPASATDPAHHDDPEEGEDEGGDPQNEPSTPASAAEQRLQADVARLTRQRVLAAVVAAAEGAGADDNRFVQLVYETTLHGGFANAIADTVKRRLGASRPRGDHPPITLDALVKDLSPQALRGLVLELALSRSGYFVTGTAKLPQDVQRAVELYEVDVAAVEKAVADELSAKRAARRGAAKAGSA